MNSARGVAHAAAKIDLGRLVEITMRRVHIAEPGRDERVRRGVSVWASVGPDAEQRAVRKLGEDLASGRWAERNPELLGLEEAELGLRLLVA